MTHADNHRLAVHCLHPLPISAAVRFSFLQWAKWYEPKECRRAFQGHGVILAASTSLVKPTRQQVLALNTGPDFFRSLSIHDLRGSEMDYAQVADFDEIWIVFDTDIPTQHGKLNEGLRLAKSKKIRCAHSTPCFEYWLLLHLDRTTAPMPKCADVIPRLSEKLGMNYSKNGEESKHLVPQLIKHLNQAEANAKWVRKYHEDGGTAFPCNPSTEVDRLITTIREALPPVHQR